jgi:GAF domain-containing protein
MSGPDKTHLSSRDRLDALGAGTLDDHERERVFNFIAELAERTGPGVELQPILDWIVERARTMLRADEGWLRLGTATDAQTFILGSLIGVGSGSWPPAVAVSVMGHVPFREPYLATPDLLQDPRFPLLRLKGDASDEQIARFRAMLAVPLMVHGRTIGLIAVTQSSPGRQWASSDVELLSIIAGRSVYLIEPELAREAADQAMGPEAERKAFATGAHIPTDVLVKWEIATRTLRGVERALVREHLESCEECRQDLELLGVRPELRLIPELEPKLPLPTFETLGMQGEKESVIGGPRKAPTSLPQPKPSPPPAPSSPGSRRADEAREILLVPSSQGERLLEVAQVGVTTQASLPTPRTHRADTAGQPIQVIALRRKGRDRWLMLGGWISAAGAAAAALIMYSVITPNREAATVGHATAPPNPPTTSAPTSTSAPAELYALELLPPPHGLAPLVREGAPTETVIRLPSGSRFIQLAVPVLDVPSNTKVQLEVVGPAQKTLLTVSRRQWEFYDRRILFGNPAQALQPGRYRIILSAVAEGSLVRNEYSFKLASSRAN